MELFRNLRLSIGSSIIRRKSAGMERVKKFNNLRNAHKIGIIWDGMMTNEFESITSFHKEMHDRGIQVDIISYYPGNVLPDEYTAVRFLSCIRRSDLSFFYIPVSFESGEFINTPYDIIIDCNFGRHKPLWFITTLSKAEFKVGPGGTFNHGTFDMTIEIPPKSDISYYLNQVKYYLEMINTGV